LAISSAKIIRRRPLTAAARAFVARRHVVQTLSVGLLILMPLLDIFRVDFAGNYVVFLWQRLPMTSLAFLLPPLVGGPLAVFFLLAQRYGRLFCSWACPQGALNEAATKSHMKLWGRRKPWPTRRDRRFPQAARRRAVWWQRRDRAWWLALAQYVGRGLLVPPLAAFGAVSYAVAPATLAGLLVGAELSHPGVWGFLTLSGIFYADLWLLQEKSCRVCFFGYLQSVVSYSQRTGVRRDAELKSECHGCSACRDICFAGVDPRKRVWEWAGRTNDLVFDDCVTCGDCLLACDDVTSRRGVPLIMQLPPNVVNAKPPDRQRSEPNRPAEV
jgi:polyferredoxin